MHYSRIAVVLVALSFAGCPGEGAAPAPAPGAPGSHDPAPTTQPGAQNALSLCLDHDDPRDGKCAAFESGKPCSDPTHWPFDVKGLNYRDAATLTALLQGEALADRERRGKPAPEAGKPKPLSDLEVVVYSGPKAPWGPVQMAMNACANAGIYRISWCACSIHEERVAIKAGGRINRPEPIKVWLPTARETSVVDEPPQEVRVFVELDPDTKSVTRRVGARFANDENELVAGMKSASELPGGVIIIDAQPKVPFGEVLHVVELCVKNGLARVEFAQPLPAQAK
jgi:biopolymer transport protein ExbD